MCGAIHGCSTLRQTESPYRIPIISGRADYHILPRLGRRPFVNLRAKPRQSFDQDLCATPYRQSDAGAALEVFRLGREARAPAGSNPCRHVEKYREGRRERFLSQAELARLGDALREAEQDKSCSPWVIAAIRSHVYRSAPKRNPDASLGARQRGT